MKNVLKNMDKEVNERNEQANRQPSEQELIERFKLRELKIVLTKLKQEEIDRWCGTKSKKKQQPKLSFRMSLRKR